LLTRLRLAALIVQLEARVRHQAAATAEKTYRSLRRHLTVSNNNYNPAKMSQSTEQTNISKVNEMV